MATPAPASPPSDSVRDVHHQRPDDERAIRNFGRVILVVWALAGLLLATFGIVRTWDAQLIAGGPRPSAGAYEAMPAGGQPAFAEPSAAGQATAAVPASLEPSAANAPVEIAASAESSPTAAPNTARPATRPALPIKLLIPSINVDAPVERVGLGPDGAMAAPEAWNDVAWYAPGYRPGEPGGAVIAGHLDSDTDLAVFWDLRKLKIADPVLVELADGTELRFSVRRTDVYLFEQVPLKTMFGASAAPMLSLITCDGAFDQGTKSYNKRLVVFAALDDS